jgi:hypothetical protein
VDVKRLAAVDMYGARGTALRRRVVLAEFALALIVALALGGWLIFGAFGLGAHVFGIWMLGAGLNYAPLTAYAISLSRPGALEAELADVNVGQELRRYSVRQPWLFVPLSLIAMTVWRPRGPRGGTRR